EAVLGRHDNGGGDVDVFDPLMGAEPTESAHGLEGDRGADPTQLLHGPTAEEGVVAELDLLGRAAAASDATDDAGTGDDARNDPVPRAFPQRAAEVPRRGCKHQALDAVAVAVPDDLPHRTAERVADRDEPLDAENVGDGRDVVGAV